MSIASEIQRLQQAKADIKTALENKGITVPSSTKIDGYSELIDNYVIDMRLVAKFNVTDTSNPTRIANATTGFSAIEIDGVVQPSVTTGYTFNTTGKHTVKYTLVDPAIIVNGSFYNCSAITDVIISHNVEIIDYNNFQNCTSLTSITIPNSVIKIGARAFRNVPWYSSYSADTANIYNNAVYINDVAYELNYKNFTSYSFKSGVKSIGGNFFENCTNLTSITIPNSIISIGDALFGKCYALTSVTVDSNNTVYDSRDNCNAIIETATNTLLNACETSTIPNNVVKINSWAFERKGISSINIPNSVTFIGDGAFQNCNSLTNVTIGSGVTTLGTSANVGYGVFKWCSSLTSITIKAATPPTLGTTGTFDDTNNCPIYVPSGSVDTYKAATNWSELASRIYAIP